MTSLGPGCATSARALTEGKINDGGFGYLWNPSLAQVGDGLHVAAADFGIDFSALVDED